MPKSWRIHSATIAWIVFAILSLPIVAFVIGVGKSDGFTFGRVVTATIEFVVVGFISWLLGRGLSKGSIVLVVVASVFMIVILVAYAAAILLLTGVLKIRVF